ncbi:MAG: alpha/beta fold hydrolase [Acidimicrobiia bacterium]
MRLILVPGFWLGAESWADVSAHLTAVGVDHRALTLPGLERSATNAASIRLVDHIAAVRAAIDEANDEVVLVGHSGAGPICHAAATERADKVRRVVHVDTWPLGPGLAVNAEMAADLEVIPLPDWNAFEPEDLVDMNEVLRQRLVDEARPQPAAVARDTFPAMSDSRLGIPATIICCEFTEAQIRVWSSSGEERLAELRRLRDVTFVELPTGHWPQFSRPRELAAALVSLA